MGSVSPTSADAYDKISLPERKTLSDLIESVIANAQRDGAKDMSMREIKAALKRVYDRDVDMSTISGRVNLLVCAERLVRDKEHPRPCTVSGQSIQPLAVPARQERLCD